VPILNVYDIWGADVPKRNTEVSGRVLVWDDFGWAKVRRNGSWVHVSINGREMEMLFCIYSWMSRV